MRDERLDVLTARRWLLSGGLWSDMTMTRCDDRDWVDCLVHAVGRVGEVEREYGDELAELRRRREREDRENPHRFEGSDPAGYLRSFYHDVCYGQGHCVDRRYEPLRAALRDAESVLGRHPALGAVLKADDHWQEFVVRAFDRDYRTSRLATVAGLLCRGRQAGENGLEISCSELQWLLDRSLEHRPGSAPRDLTTGYHVLLFYGLRLPGKIEIAANLKVVPLEHTEAFLDMEVVRKVAPPSDRRNGWEGVGALVETVQWSTELFPPGGEPVRTYDSGSFYSDGKDFLSLLAVVQGVSIVTMAFFPDRTHRTVALLLGGPRLSGNMGVRAYASLGIPRALDVDALDKARRLYWEPERQRYRDYGMVVSRLSEALARTGHYSDDDRILDVAIALEQMYELDQGEISFKLKMRAACFLESETEARKRVFKKVGDLYKARSAIVHRRSKESSRASKREAFETGFDVARASAIKLLGQGPPRNWNEMVMAGGTKNPDPGC